MSSQAPLWSPDILGPDYQATTLLVPTRGSGNAPGNPGGSYRATLVRHNPVPAGPAASAPGKVPAVPGDVPAPRLVPRGPAASGNLTDPGDVPAPRLVPRAPVLFIHGWSDYFYNTALAEFFTARGYPFYALDLHNHGRSLASPELGGYVADLADYDAEILAAHELIAREHPNPPGDPLGAGLVTPDAADSSAAASGTVRIVLMGHSTGGLIATLWAHHNPGLVSHLILNSPWLEIQGGAAIRRAATPLVQLADLRPLMRMRVPERSFYWRGISNDAYGEWPVDKALRPPQAFPVRAGWMKAILAAQQEVATGLKLPMPVLVLLSAKSMLGPVWSDAMLKADVVLDVRSLALRTLSLGDSVSLERIDGALHEVLLSREPVRAEGYSRLARWLRGYVESGEPECT